MNLFENLISPTDPLKRFRINTISFQGRQIMEYNPTDHFTVHERDANRAIYYTMIGFHAGYQHPQGIGHAIAIHYLEMALKINASLPYTWYVLGNIYYRMPQYHRAISCYKQALKIDPEASSVWNHLGNAFAGLNLRLDALDAYQHAVRSNPNNHYAWFNLGAQYTPLGQHEDAIQCYQKSIHLHPHDDLACYNLGMVLFN